MNNEFKINKSKQQTVYTLESATGGSTPAGAIANVDNLIGGIQRRKGDNFFTPEDSTTPMKPRRGPLRPQTGGGQHKDKTKTIPRKEKHKTPAMETQRMSAGQKLTRAVDRQREKNAPDEKFDRLQAQLKAMQTRLTPKEQPTKETTGDKSFDSMMKDIKKGTKKQATADRREQRKQDQERAKNAFGSMFGGDNPVGNLKIREQDVEEEMDIHSFSKLTPVAHHQGRLTGQQVIIPLGDPKKPVNNTTPVIRGTIVRRELDEIEFQLTSESAFKYYIKTTDGRIITAPENNVYVDINKQDVAEGRWAYDKRTASMQHNTEDPDQRHGLYIDGKLIKTYSTRDGAENVKRRDPKFKNATIKKIAEGVTDMLPGFSGGWGMIFSTLGKWGIPVATFAAVAAAYGVAQAAAWLQKGHGEFGKIAAKAMQEVDKDVIYKMADKLEDLQNKALAEDDIEDFLNAGGKITQVKPQRGPRRPGLGLASKHIGGGGDRMKPSRTGRGANTQGKPVVAVEEGDEYNEYSDEVDMVKNNLHTIVRACKDLAEVLIADENLPEWVEEKISMAKQNMVTVAEYIQSQHEQGHIYKDTQEDHSTATSGWGQGSMDAAYKSSALSSAGWNARELGEDSYIAELESRLAEKIPKNAPVKTYIDDFAKAAKTPNAKGHHQFRNKSPEKVRQMAIAASYGAKSPSKKKK